MAATTFNEQQFEQKLVSLKDTQEAINALSSWCLQHKDHHKQIVTCWLHCLKRVKIDVRLSLFYLANDVIQYSKRKHLDFVESWGTALQKATPLVRDDKVRNRIHRIFKIWEEREVYDEAFISDLCGLLTTTVKNKSEPVEHTSDPADFQPSALVRKIKEIKVLEENTDIKFKRIKDNKLPLTDAESMRLSLKDRRHGSDVAAEVDSGVKKMEAFVKALESEISSRDKLLDLLRQATLFYETQRGEAKIVANAYRNFGGRLKTRQKALEEVIASLLSPLPSPDVNAPSPSPDSDLDSRAAQQASAPTQETALANGTDLGFPLVPSSFIGSARFLDMTKDVFSGEPAPVPQPATEAQPIEVIGGRDAAASFDVAEFFKSLMPAKDMSLPPPPMPPVFADWSSGGPWDQPPTETPQSPPMFEKQAPHAQPVEYDDSLPVPPVPDVDHRTLMSVQHSQHPPPELPPVNLGAPPPHMGSDVDHRGLPGMALPSMDVPPPVISDRGALIAPPPPVGMLGPPPPPPVIKVLLDVDQRNLISLTGTSGSRTPMEGYRNRKDEGGYPTQPPSQRGAFRKEEGYPPIRQPWAPHRPPDLRDTDPRIKDNVESIDMDVSEEDEEESLARAGGELPEQMSFTGPVFVGEPSFRGSETGRRTYGGPSHMSEPPVLGNEPPHLKPTLGERLTVLASAGAKLVAPIEQPSPEKNGYSDNGNFGDDIGEGFDEEFGGNEGGDYEEDYGGDDGNDYGNEEGDGFGADYGNESSGDFGADPFRSGFGGDSGGDFRRDFGGSGGRGFRKEFAPRPRWHSPRPPRGLRPMRPCFPYRTPSPRPPRGLPRLFRPRGRW